MSDTLNWLLHHADLADADGCHEEAKGLREAAAELTKLREEIERWREAFYREERRAVEYHNADQVEGGYKCGHPVSCLRNRKGGGGVHCLMCEQDAEITALRAGLREKDAALSAIDYALGEPNEMECSLYDADMDEGRVVAKVKAQLAITERDEAHIRLSVLAMENAGLRLSIPPDDVIRDAARYRTLSRLAERFVGATGATFWELQPLQGETFEGAVDNAEIATKGGDDDGR